MGECLIDHANCGRNTASKDTLLYLFLAKTATPSITLPHKKSKLYAKKTQSSQSWIYIALRNRDCGRNVMVFEVSETVSASRPQLRLHQPHLSVIFRNIKD